MRYGECMFGYVLFVLVTVLGIRGKELEVNAEQAHVNKEKILNIHIVAHTHDDVGWLKTVEQYYHGRNSTIQRACVRCILDSIISALQHSSSRKFTFVEMAFFSAWWGEQSNDMKESVRDLVKTGQLSFANGGWCMHDEATTHYMGMIDQTTLGHQFLKEEFDYVPSVGWQLDPFGHSATQASLLTSEAGFNALYFGRIDYQDLEQRKEARDCEGIWESSQNLKNSSIFWGLTGSYSGNYGAPQGFCFDIFCTDDPLVGLDEHQLKSRIGDFLSKIKVQVDQTKGSNVMVTMGSDFQYESAIENFQNLDILIENINNGMMSNLIPDFDKVNAFYSTPELYTSYKYDEFIVKGYEQINTSIQSSILRSKPFLSIKTDDFFPYSDCDHCFWTGYFSSRPGLKKLERIGSSLLHAVRQIQTLFGSVDQMRKTSEIYNLETAMGIAQHHDAVSGTSKQHVAYDYAMKIQAGINEAAKLAANIIKSRLVMDSEGTDISNLSYCQLRNISICSISQAATASVVTNTDIYVVVYNALGSKRSDILSLPVSSEATFVVEKREKMVNNRISWKKVSSALFPNTNTANVPESAPYNLYFDTGIVAPIGMSLYRVHKHVTKTLKETSSNGIQNASSIQRLLRNRQKQPVIIQNELIKMKFEMGVMTKITLLAEDIEVDIKQEWGYYTSFQQSLVNQRDSDARLHSVEVEQCVPKKLYGKEVLRDSKETQNSGAYIFRPSSPIEELNKIWADPSKTEVFSDDILTEIHTKFKVPWIKQITRITKGQPYVDIEYTIGPIPIDDGKGKEVVTRFISNIENNSTFQTDSNGREFLSRVRSARQSFEYKEFEPIAGNYYPVNAAIFLEDDQFAMTILTDRSQGGTSTKDGVLELMVQRRTIKDDGRGVGEAMNETDSGVTPYPPYGDASRQGDGVVIKGTHRLLFGKGRIGASLARSQMDAMFSPLHLFAASAPSNSDISFHTNSLSAIDDYLPPNVQLITTKVLAIHENDIIILLRLGHAYGSGESDDLSKPVAIDISTILTGYVIKSMDEKTLTGNQGRDEWNTRKMSWINNFHQERRIVSDIVENHSRFTIVVEPMEIRTFEVHAQIIS